MALRPDGGWWRLTVADNGIGFDEKYLDKIFTVFQRLHGRSEYEGSGVGLAVCRRIVERHNGDITARSVPGEGAAFLITLPAAQPAPGAAPGAAPDDAPETADPSDQTTRELQPA
jgi:signal transduction histidine kinase